MMGLPRPRGAFSLFFTTTLLLLLSFHGFAKEVSSGKGDTPLPVIHWGGCGISKLGFMKDLAKAYTEETGIRIELEGGGATKGIRKTAERKLDLGGSCRLPLVLKNQDGIYSVASNERRIKMIPVGWDALVVITNKANKEVTAISREQLQKVFTGEITNWGQLGAATDRPINLYIRKGKISGVGLTLRQQLFNNRDQAFT